MFVRFFRKTAFMTVMVGTMAFGFTLPSSAKEILAQAEIAAAPPAAVRLEVMSACDVKGALFKVVNRGPKWPRTGHLKLFYADDKTLIGQRRLRLAENQRVSFVVREEVMKNRPVAVWVEPQWYKRSFRFDAALSCP